MLLKLPRSLSPLEQISITLHRGTLCRAAEALSQNLGILHSGSSQKWCCCRDKWCCGRAYLEHRFHGRSHLVLHQLCRYNPLHHQVGGRRQRPDSHQKQLLPWWFLCYDKVWRSTEAFRWEGFRSFKGEAEKTAPSSMIPGEGVVIACSSPSIRILCWRRHQFKLLLKDFELHLPV